MSVPGVPLSEEPRDRVLVGTSIGGFSAIYGAMQRSHVFGSAIALSPSAWVEDGYLTRLARLATTRPAIAADVGSGERQPIRDHCRELFSTLAERGGPEVLAGEVDGMHNEDSWRARLPRLLRHVLGPE